MERAKGIEPSSKAWEAFILPMNYARMNIAMDAMCHFLRPLRNNDCLNNNYSRNGLLLTAMIVPYGWNHCKTFFVWGVVVWGVLVWGKFPHFQAVSRHGRNPCRPETTGGTAP